MIEQFSPMNNSKAIHDILESANALLLDFDGPVCSIFTGTRAAVIADQLRSVLTKNWRTQIPSKIHKSEDPFEIFKYAAFLGEKQAHAVEAALTVHEIKAAATAEPTPGAQEFIDAWRTSHRPIAVVTNNSTTAVIEYLQNEDLYSKVDFIVGRSTADPSLLKPCRYLIDQAVGRLKMAPTSCVLVGDSLSDIQAARSAQVLSIGYANKPGKSQAFQRDGSNAIIDSMFTLAELVTSN